MFYKFGWDKILLRWGKIFGLVGFCLVVFQVLSASRLRFSDRIFGLDRVFAFHRMTGIGLAIAALAHPVMVMASEDMIFIPLQVRYWPEFTGAFLLAGLVSTAILSTLHKAMNIPFHLWYGVHRWAGAVLTAALFIHVLFVSESFEGGFPRAMALGALGVCGLLLVYQKMRPLVLRKSLFEVASVEPAGLEATRLELTPVSGRTFHYQPGQFGFFRFVSSRVSGEEHPFTLASTPTRPEALELVVGQNGDWTRGISRMEPGARCRIDGPYGLFSHLRCPENVELVMIAGGIGITPMLSMIRYMADTRDLRKVTLIWSHRTREHAFSREELEHLELQWKNLRVVHWFTRDSGPGGQGRRLDGPGLRGLLSEASPSSFVFLCGPPDMIRSLRKHLPGLGFSAHRIFTERFSI